MEPTTTTADPTEPTQEALVPVRVWVLVDPAAPTWNVATIELSERWRKAFKDIDLGAPIDVQTVDLRELPKLMESRKEPVWLADGGWVIDTFGLDACLESGKFAIGAPLLTFANKKGLAPIVRLDGTAAAALASSSLASMGAMAEDVCNAASAKGIPDRRIEFARHFWSRVDDRRSAKRAEWGLLKELQFRPGGLVAQYLNRPISIRVSRLILDTHITPNQTTYFTFVIGLIGIAMIFRASYLSAVLGALLLHINSILDGVDGELAKMRYQTSSWGAYLDSIADEILNALCLYGLGYYVWKSGGWPGYLALGLFSGSVSFFYACIHWHCKLKHGLGFYWWWEAYKPRKQVQRQTNAWFYLKKLFCKDSILLLVLLAVAIGFVEPLLWVAAAGGAMAVILFVIHIPIKRARW